MKRLFGLTWVLLLGALSLNALAQAPPNAAAKKEVVWVCKGPIERTVTGMARAGANSVTIKSKGDDGMDYSNTITWTPPPLEIPEGTEVTLTLTATTSPGAIDWAGVAGAWNGIGTCTDLITGDKAPAVGSGRNSEAHATTIEFKFKPSVAQPVIEFSGGNSDLGYMLKTWKYERQERDALAPPEGTRSGIRITRITSEDPDIPVDVEVIAADGVSRSVTVGMKLKESDRLRTGFKSSVLLTFTNDAGATLATVVVEEMTAFKIGIFRSGTINEVELLLKTGGVAAQVNRLAGSTTSFVIKQPTVTASVRGTSFKVYHDPKTDISTITVQEGVVEVTPTNAALKPISLKACQQVKVSATAISAVESTGPQVTADGTGCCSYPCPDPHAAKLTLQAPELLAGKGQEVLVPVYLIKPTDVANINWTLTYDPKVVSPNADVPKGNLLDKASYFANTKESGIIYGTFMETAGLKGTATGTVAVVKFQVLGETGSQTPFHLAVTTINNPAGGKLPIDLLHGSLHVVGQGGRPAGTGPNTPPGDGPMALDALTALKMSVKLISVDMNYDVDHVDGVTSRDAVIIAQRRLAQLAKGNQ